MKIKNYTHLIIFIFFVLTNFLFSQKNNVVDNNKIDNVVFLFSKRANLTIDNVVNFVNQTFKNEEDKVRAYFSYISLNISYNLDRLTELKLYSASSFQNHLKVSLSETPATVFNQKKAVCEGYSNLMQYFCKKSGIICETVIGYVKIENEVKTDLLHEWNSVQIDSLWYLIDITWSNGYVNHNNEFIKQFSELYYLKNNAYFIKDHLPLDPMWQLTNNPFSKNYFFKNDTTNRFFSNDFRFRDSISKFLRLNQEEKELQEIINYSNFDTANIQLKNGLDVVIFNKAIDKYNVSTILYEEFVTYYNKELVKNPNKRKCAKAQEIISNSKKQADKAYQIIANYSFRNTSIFERKIELIENLTKLKAELKRATTTLNKILQSAKN